MRKKMYRKGREYKRISLFFKDIKEGKYVFWSNKPRPLHPAFILSLPLRVVLSGVFYKALKNTGGNYGSN